MMSRIAVLAATVLFAAIIGQPGAAQTSSVTAKPAKPPKVLIYLSPAEVDAARLIPPRAADDSAVIQAELAELHQLAASASPERLAQAKWDDAHESPELLGPALGTAFDVKALPATADLLAVVQADASVASSSAKRLYQRKRPWVLDPTIKTCDPNDKPLNSYPSGHATLGYSLALTMAVLAPAKAEALLARASDYALSREICGSHLPSDTQASEALATALVTALLTKPAFQAKLDAARAELEAKGMLAP